MKFYAIRPKRRGRRLKTKAALYTVAFDVGELRRHDSSFNGFCRNDCEFGIGNKCEEQCVKDGDNKVYHPESKFKSHLFYQDFENWIRIYAVKYTEDATGVDNYIITGGGIKLVEKMSDNAVVEYEEKKQDAVIRYLIENEITTREKIETLIL